MVAKDAKSVEKLCFWMVRDIFVRSVGGPFGKRLRTHWESENILLIVLNCFDV